MKVLSGKVKFYGVLIVLSIVLLLISVCSKDGIVWNGASELYETEKNFAKHCAGNKIKPAFLKYIDDSSIVFFPHPSNGKAFYYLLPESPQDSSVLTWFPEYVEVSNDGTLGFSYGPAVSKKSLTDTLPRLSHYLSIWKKRDNEWKLVLDKGVKYSEPYLSKTVILHENNAGSTSPGKISMNYVIEVDRKFNEGLIGSTNEYTVIYRQGNHPKKFSEEIMKQIKTMKDWVVLGGDISGSCDLAYLYGYYGISESEKGYFIRIWKYENEKWFLRFDSLIPY